MWPPGNFGRVSRGLVALDGRSIWMSKRPRSIVACGGDSIGGSAALGARAGAPSFSATLAPGTGGKNDVAPRTASARGKAGWGSCSGAASAGRARSAAIAQARRSVARRLARVVARSCPQCPTALLSPQQETRFRLSYAESGTRTANRAVRQAYLVNHLSQNGN